ncbi:MAG: hypothetical protein WKG01_17130 [Kofleriaceae bacterium]
MAAAITITRASELTADPALLTAAERAVCSDRSGLRRDEWIRGRLAVRAAMVTALGTRAAAIDVLIAPDAGPLVVGGPPCAISLSHDDAWIAVAIAVGAYRIGIDLCARSKATRVIDLLARLGVQFDCEPLAAFAALEAVLKLRRLGVMELREHATEVRARGASQVEVHGLGAATLVELQVCPEHVVGWALEALA